MIRMIVPVYNAEQYLEQAIDSIINQTIFDENIEIHLINDASSDSSLQICNRYKEKYPKNIIVTNFEVNKGVSSVRNMGVKCAKKDNVEIIGFMDSDDYLEERSLESAKKFFDEHKDIDIAVSRMMLVGTKTGDHKSNWRFEDKEVVDICDNPNYTHYFAGGVYIRNIKDKKLVFDKKLNFWEDALALNKLIIDEGKYGLINGSHYYYRKIEEGNSLVDKSWKEPYRYNGFLKDGYMSLIRYSKKKKHCVIPYVQYVVAQHMRLYLIPGHFDAVMGVLSDEKELEKFKKRLRKVLKHVSVETIAKLDTLPYVKEGLLTFKMWEKVRCEMRYENNDMIFSCLGYDIGEISTRGVRILGRIKEGENKGFIRGRFATPLYAMKEEDYIFATNGVEKIKSKRHGCKIKKYILDKVYRNFRYAGFVIDIPSDWDNATWGINIDGHDILLEQFNPQEIEWMED